VSSIPLGVGPRMQQMMEDALKPEPHGIVAPHPMAHKYKKTQMRAAYALKIMAGLAASPQPYTADEAAAEAVLWADTLLHTLEE
jgi:hypothetical protein